MGRRERSQIVARAYQRRGALLCDGDHATEIADTQGGDMKQLGFIGVGMMGHHMAGRLLEAGHSLIIYDTNETAMQRLEQRGAKRAASPADVASQAETVLVSLPTPEIGKGVGRGQNGERQGNKAKEGAGLSR